MTTLPQPKPYIATELDHRIAAELERAHRERAKAKAQGFWPVVAAQDAVIEVLMRMQKGNNPPSA